MAGFETLQVTGTVGAALARLGFSPSDPYLQEVLPTAARGNNMVVVAPPAAVHALPGLAGALNARADHQSGLLHILAPESALSEWESVVALMTEHTGQPAHTVRSLARATRLIQAGTIQVLISTPEAALTLAQRSSLKLDQTGALFLAWPESWESEAAITSIMQDLGRDIQRVVYTTEQSRVNDMVERYARRALTVGPSVQPLPESADTVLDLARKTRGVRTVITPWIHRDSALKEVLELLDPATSAVWTLTSAAEPAPGPIPGTPFVTGQVPDADLIVAYDLPTAAQLGQLAARGEVILLVPPTAHQWVERVVPTARPIRLSGGSDAAAADAAARRTRIATVIQDRSAESSLLALAPMFERYDPALVAAALYHLWLERPTATVAPMPGNDVMNAATARVWCGVGRKDGATANDFVGVLTKELSYDRSRIGKIDVRELYSLVEVPAADAEMLAGKLNGVTIRRRRITARIDRGGKVRAAN
ncbi:MAG: DbpA RNA binding domain-containing protein [Gemmatimonadota bacterium]